MVIYILAIIVVAFILFAFYLKVDDKQKRRINYVLPNCEREGYINAAYRCRKNNSPVSQEPFHKLYLYGAEKANNENFILSDWE